MKFEIKNNFFLILLILSVLSVIYYVLLKQAVIIKNKPDSSFIFIGGKARSGTTLIRAILDVDSTIKCGIETKIIPRFLKLILTYFPYLTNNNDKVNQAAKSFITNIVIGRNLSPYRQCILNLIFNF